ncbi:MAG: hypothetical protein RR806_05650 [Oscillospiraceae bacterium]
MISPIKFVVSKVEEIKIIIHDFPLYFNIHFLKNFFIDFNIKLCLWLRIKAESTFKIISDIKLSLGIGLKPKDSFNIVPTFKVRSLSSLKFYDEFSIVPNVTFHTKIRSFIRLIANSTFTMGIDIKTKLAMRIREFTTPFTIKMEVKSIVAVFYKIYERGDLSLEQLCNDEKINTLNNLLWGEIN